MVKVSDANVWSLVNGIANGGKATSSPAGNNRGNSSSLPAGQLASANNISGEVLREIVAFGEGEDRTGIYNIMAECGREVTIKGKAEEGEIIPGLNYVFTGSWVNHDRYGRQFMFRHFAKTKPHGRRGILAYLKTVPNIGEVTAGRLYDLFGDKAIETLRETPAKVSAQIPRLRLQQAEESAEYLREQEDMEYVTVDLMDLFANRKIQRRAISEMVKKWGCRTTEIVRRNPYVTCQFSGVGFQTADSLYMALGHPPAATKRQTRYVQHFLGKRNGDTWVTVDDIKAGLRSELSGVAVDVVSAVKLGLRARMLSLAGHGGHEIGIGEFRAAAEGDENATDKSHQQQQFLALKSRADDERDVAETIADLARFSPRWPKMSEVRGLYDHQRERLSVATSGAVGCLIGTPGTGKSSSASRLISAVVRCRGAGRVAVCCPTGKAAVRITELLNANGVDIAARTIHSTLGFGGGPGGFNYGRDNPLPIEFLFVDETSMVDCSLMASLLRAIAPGTNILFIGDPNQLPPVGHGCPLRDFIDAGVPTGELTEIHRNGGRIVQACKEIRETGKFQFSDKWDLENGDNLIIQDCRTPQAILLRLESLYRKIQESGKYDMRWGVQTICAVNDAGSLNRKALNLRLRELLNPHGETVKGNPFRVGDKVVCLSNGKVPSVDPDHELADDKGKVYCANGEVGEVIGFEGRTTIVEMRNPSRTIRVLHGAEKKNSKSSAFGDGGENCSGESSESGCNFDLAYAASCHKTQGDEYGLVFIIGDDSFAASNVVDRAWVYTAISRAKKGAIYLGKRETIEGWCAKRSIDSRRTFLADMLREPLRLALANPIEL